MRKCTIFIIQLNTFLTVILKMNSRENKNSIDFILFWQILKNMLRSYHFCGIPFVKHLFFATAF